MARLQSCNRTESQNFLLACVFRHGGIAILLSSLCNLFLMTYAGYVPSPSPGTLDSNQRLTRSSRFFVNIAQIPPVLRWLRYFSTLGYTLEALAINEVGSGLQIVVRPLYFAFALAWVKWLMENRIL